jgi:hypothetical protein
MLRYLVKGPGYLNVLFGFGARTLTGMAGLTVHKVYHRPLLFFGGGGDILLVNGGKIYIYF